MSLGEREYRNFSQSGFSSDQREQERASDAGQDTAAYTNNVKQELEAAHKNVAFKSTDLVGADGSFLGFRLNPSVAGLLRYAVNVGSLPIRRYLEEHGGKSARAYARANWGYNSHQAMHFGNRVADAIGYATIFHQQIGDAVGITARWIKSMNRLRGSIEPILQASGENTALSTTILFGSTGNTVIDNSKAKINAGTWQEIIQSGAYAFSNIPQLYIRHQDIKARNLKRAEDQELEMLDELSMEDQNKVLMKGLKNDLQLEQQKHKLFGEYEQRLKADYMQEFEAYKATNLTKLRTEFNNAIRSDSDWARQMRNQYRIEPNYYVGRVDPVTRRPIPIPGMFNIPKEALDRYTKEHFAIEHKGGIAWDSSWLPESYQRGRNNSVTYLRDQVTTNLNKWWDRKNDARAKAAIDKKDDSVNKTFIEQLTVGGGSAIGEIANQLLGIKGREALKAPIAIDLIEQVNEAAIEAGKTNTDLNSVAGLGAHKDQQWPLVKAVHEIFQKNQEDCATWGKNSAYVRIRDYEFRHFAEKNWDAKAIAEMNDAELTAYEFAIKHIAQRISNGTIKGEKVKDALVSLVGFGKIVSKNGMAFGPEHKPSDDVTVKDSILKEIDKVSVLMKPQTEDAKENDTSKAEFISQLVIPLPELKAMFGSEGLKGDELLLLFHMIDCNLNVQKDLEELTGLNAEQITSLRKQIVRATLMEAEILELAELARENPKKLQSLQETPVEIATLQEVATKAEENKACKDVMDEIGKDKKKTITTMIANFLTAGKDPKHWEKTIQRERELIAEKKAAEKEVKQEQEQEEVAKIKSAAGDDADLSPKHHKKHKGDEADYPDRDKDEGAFGSLAHDGQHTSKHKPRNKIRAELSSAKTFESDRDEFGMFASKTKKGSGGSQGETRISF